MANAAVAKLFSWVVASHESGDRCSHFSEAVLTSWFDGSSKASRLPPRLTTN